MFTLVEALGGSGDDVGGGDVALLGDGTLTAGGGGQGERQRAQKGAFHRSHHAHYLRHREGCREPIVGWWDAPCTGGLNIW